MCESISEVENEVALGTIDENALSSCALDVLANCVSHSTYFAAMRGLMTDDLEQNEFKRMIKEASLLSAYISKVTDLSVEFPDR